MKRNIILISKGGSVKSQNAKNVLINELYKKCKLKNNTDFEKRHTWTDENVYISIYAKDNGRAGQENKYDLPSPIDTNLFFSSMVAIKHSNKEPDDDSILNFTKEEWEIFYNKQMGGSEDLEQEDSAEEIEEIPQELLSKQGYSKEDGFIVEDDDPLSTGKDDDVSEGEFIDETDTDASDKEQDEGEDLDEEAKYGNESDYNEVEEVGDEEDSDDDADYEADDADGDGSELSEEEYKY